MPSASNTFCWTSGVLIRIEPPPISVAVDHDVVGAAAPGAGIGVEVARRRGERVVHRVPALLVLVPLEHREVDDPEEVVALSARGSAELEAQLAEHARGDLGARRRRRRSCRPRSAPSAPSRRASRPRTRNLAIGERQPSRLDHGPDEALAPSALACSVSSSKRLRGNSPRGRDSRASRRRRSAPRRP